MIAIYEGEGAIWSGPTHPRIGVQQILQGGLNSLKLFIMPGGRDVPYHRHLQGIPNGKIKDFVEKGGIYLGICAGGYYGCQSIEFDKGLPLEVCADRELAFFGGKAIGPAFGKGTFFYGSERGAKTVRLGTSEGGFYSYYNGGCFFEGEMNHVRVLARYLDLPRSPAAIIECSIGRGKAILSGVHLELQLSQCPENSSADEMKMEMKDRLTRIGADIG